MFPFIDRSGARAHNQAVDLLGKRPIVKVVLIVMVAFVATNRSATAQVFWDLVAKVVALSGEPIAATHAVLSEHEIERIRALSPQEQAETLMQRAVNGYDGATDIIEARVDSWVGAIGFSDQIYSLTNTGYESADLRVRVASVEVSLAAYGYTKESDNAYKLIEDVRNAEGDMTTNLWVLGLLANRGVERELIVRELAETVKAAEPNVRHWSIEALGKTGSDEVIPILTDVFRFEPELWLKERAACNLADSGMFTKEQRMLAIPELLTMADHPSIEPQAQAWVYQALREISGERIENDATAWRSWAASEVRQ